MSIIKKSPYNLYIYAHQSTHKKNTNITEQNFSVIQCSLWYVYSAAAKSLFSAY